MDRSLERERVARTKLRREEGDQGWVEVELLMDAAHRTWATYMQWYTWFFGANLVVLSWMFIHSEGTVLKAQSKTALCAVWIAFNCLGLASSAFVAIYSRHVHRQVVLALAHAGDHKHLDAEIVAPRAMTTWAAVANGASLLINIAIWLYILRSY